MSAASLATSAADSTEIPTSAAWIATASFTPSPRNATSRPTARCARIKRAFCSGLDAGEDRRLDDPGPERIVVERRDVGPGHGPADLEAQIPAHLLGDDDVVAGDDLDRDPEPGQSLEGLRGVELRLVQEDQVAEEGQVVLVGRAHRRGGGVGTGGDRHDAPTGRELGGERSLRRVRDRLAGREDGFGCSLRDHDPTEGRVVDEHRRHAPVVVERHDREPAHVGQRDRGRVGCLPECDVEGVAADRLPVLDGRFVADQSEAEHLRGGITGQVHGAHEADVAFGEGAGLVREQDLDVAEIFDADQPLDQDALAGQAPRPGRQARRDHRGQQLGGDAHRDRQREQQRFEQGALQDEVDDEDRGGEHSGDLDEKHGEVPEAALELGHLLALAQARRRSSRTRCRARCRPRRPRRRRCRRPCP